MIAHIWGQMGHKGVGSLETDELDALSARELHDRAVGYAVHHGDFGFLWELLKMIPPAEAASGNSDQTANDLTRVSALLSDAMVAGEGELGEALRPFYIAYLSEHPDAMAAPEP
ncbi:hypothetical protein HS048_31670 [Planomonospora sp. ID91781]|uniref:Uncharacterized protein n=3 Tax=Planomonospora TaxID=1998 RepID=A0A171CZ88_9ACTN|nr:hypothetical protein [Planomonospora sp. ID91781]GAT67448.1 hypothetical protein PS9374_03103 [Planomonospora sphaerica]GGK51686.1 hypothetical protein GCM10010126_09020 [Planomonospora parontospora]GII06961.1 hypothetical protein Ppa06_07590 [Planomonospora parontospora subsp. parontospora]